MKTTLDLRREMLRVFDEFKSGRLTAQETKTMVSVAKVVCRTMMIEATAAALQVDHFAPVEMLEETAPKRVSLRAVA